MINPLPDGYTLLMLQEVLAERQGAIFRSLLFADKAMPDDLALAYEQLAKRHGYGVAMRVLGECRAFAEDAYRE